MSLERGQPFPHPPPECAVWCPLCGKPCRPFLVASREPAVPKDDEDFRCTRAGRPTPYYRFLCSQHGAAFVMPCRPG